MSGNESKLQKRCIDWCKSKGLLAVNIHGGGWGNKGFPDLLVFGNGECLAVELKYGSTYTQQPAQKMWEHRFRKVGINYQLMCSFEQFTAEIEKRLIDGNN